MLSEAAISKAYFTSAARLSQGPGSALVSELLGDVAGKWLCLVEVERNDGRFTLVLDANWAELGLQVAALPSASDDALYPDIELPRPAIRAVIAGWPAEWDASSNPRMGVHVSDDMVAHISVSESSVRANGSPDPQQAV